MKAVGSGNLLRDFEKKTCNDIQNVQCIEILYSHFSKQIIKLREIMVFKPVHIYILHLAFRI